MAVKATNKTTTTAKEPAQKATQTTLKVEPAQNVTEKKPAVKNETAAEAKKEPVAKKEAVDKKEPATKAATAKKPAAKKPATKKTTTRKSTAKKTTTRKTAAKKTETVSKAEVFVQYKGFEFSESSIMEKVNAAWEAEGKKVSAIKKVKLYVKPEDGKAYYVINEGLKNGSTGAVEL